MDPTQPESTDPALEFTGERFTPECVREIFYEHWHRYAWAAQLVEGLHVLDAACGEGYGSHLLARHAARVDGVDIDPQAIEHARTKYIQDMLDYHQASALELPFADDRFDCVVSFETLEHLTEHDELMTEFRRVLKPGGFLIISSPDKKTYSDDTGYRNEFHLRELYRNEFENLLSRHFPSWHLFGQKLLFQSALWSLNQDSNSAAQHLLAERNHTITASAQPASAPLYFIALAAASADALPETADQSMFTDRDESIYQHYNDEVGKHIHAGELLAERELEIERLRALKTPLWARLKQRLTGRQ